MIIPSPNRHPTFLMDDGPGHYLASPNNANWGLLALVLFLTRLSQRWASVGPSGFPFGLGDLGNEDRSPPGGRHHVGAGAVDIYIIHKQGLRRFGACEN